MSERLCALRKPDDPRFACESPLGHGGACRYGYTRDVWARMAWGVLLVLLVSLLFGCASSPSQPPVPPQPDSLITLADASLSVTLDTFKGGAIVSLHSLTNESDSGNIVDNGDAVGRQIQAAFYDGDWPPDFWPCPGGTLAQWGYDPVQAGNACQLRSGGQLVTRSTTSVTTQTTPLQWNAALGRSKLDLVQTVTIIAPGVLKIDYTVTNQEDHEIGADNWQEMPGAYFDPHFSQAWFINPFGALSTFTITHPGTNDLRPLTTGEPWIALSRADGVSVALVLPSHLTPWAIQLGGGNDHPASFLDALQWLQLQPNQTQTNTAFLVVGRSLNELRSRIATIN